MYSRLDRTALTLAALMSGFLPALPGPASADVTTLVAEMDAHVILGDPDVNYGYAEQLLVADPHQSDISRAFLQFNLEEIPQGATISWGKLRLFNLWTGDECAEIAVYRVSSRWEESSITWRNQPAFAAYDDYEHILNLGDEGALLWLTWDVTDLVAGWADRSFDNYGLVLKVPVERADWYCARTFVSRENHEVELGPQLVVYYDLEGYEGPIAADSHVDESLPDSNFGGSDHLLVANTSWEVLRSYVQFDLSGIPPGSDIVHAELLLENFAWWDDQCPKIELHRVLEAWEEYEVTWNSQPQFVAEPECGCFLRDDFFPTDFYSWDITQLVQGWIDEMYPNCGLVLRPRYEGEDEFRVARAFFSREANADYQQAGIYVLYRAMPGVDEGDPGSLTLMLSCYPNPSRGTMDLRFGLPTPAHTTLKVYDAGGRLVRTLFSREVRGGKHRLSWNGTDDRGRELPSGTYLFRLENGDSHRTEKALLAR